jgi:hypothetical protein
MSWKGVGCGTMMVGGVGDLVGMSSLTLGGSSNKGRCSGCFFYFYDSTRFHYGCFHWRNCASFFLP